MDDNLTRSGWIAVSNFWTTGARMKGNCQEFLRITQMEGRICNKIVPCVAYYDCNLSELWVSTTRQSPVLNTSQES